MPLFNTESIVLRSYNLAEADRIVVVYTNGGGLIRGVAKGARRIKSRFGSMLEPFSEIRIEYFQKEQNELVSIQNAELIRSAFETASDPLLLQTYSYIADLLLEFTPPNDPNGVLYRMLRACIHARITSQAHHESLKLYFETWLMRLDGYLPDWSACSICRRPIAESETAYLRPAFLLACGECSGTTTNTAISPPDRMLQRAIQQVAPDEFLAMSDRETATVRELSSVMSKLIASHSGNAPLGNSLNGKYRV